MAHLQKSKSTGQIEINFFVNNTPEVISEEDEYLKRRKAFADANHVMYPETIYEKEPGKWPFIKGDDSVDVWNQMYSTSDADDMYKH